LIGSSLPIAFLEENMKHSTLIRFRHMTLVISLVAVLAACAPSATEAPAATEPPITESPTAAPTEAPTEVPTEAPTEAPTEPPTAELPVVELPDEAVSALTEVANAAFGQDLPSLASEHTVIYALPDSGTAFLLTPVEAGPEETAEDLIIEAKENALDTTRILGGLTVIQDDITELPAGDYVITLASNGATVEFNTIGEPRSFEAVIRSLPLALPAGRSVALITSSQMCLAWNQTQVCALIQTPLKSDWQAEVEEAISSLDSDPSDFDLSRAIPDIEGSEMLQQCQDALNETPPAYSDCKSNVLAVPALNPGNIPTPQVETEQTIDAIGALVVLESLSEEIYADPGLSELVGTLPAGNYITYVVLPAGWEPNPLEPTATQVLQAGLTEQYFLPSVSGGQIIGEPQLGTGPSNDEEAIIVNLWIGRHCYCKRRQCPWLL
jgi:hypothetical protein